jgi:hypothetical protein
MTSLQYFVNPFTCSTKLTVFELMQFRRILWIEVDEFISDWSGRNDGVMELDFVP